MSGRGSWGWAIHSTCSPAHITRRRPPTRPARPWSFGWRKRPPRSHLLTPIRRARAGEAGQSAPPPPSAGWAQRGAARRGVLLSRGGTGWAVSLALCSRHGVAGHGHSASVAHVRTAACARNSVTPDLAWFLVFRFAGPWSDSSPSRESRLKRNATAIAWAEFPRGTPLGAPIPSHPNPRALALSSCCSSLHNERNPSILAIQLWTRSRERTKSER